MNTYFKLFSGLFIASVGLWLPSVAFADSTPVVNSLTLGGGTTITVSPSASITAVVNVSTHDASSGSRWRGVTWRIATSSGSGTCVSLGSSGITGTASSTFTFTAPSLVATYNVYIRAYTNTSCTDDASNTFVRSNGITVAIPDTTPPSLSSRSISSNNALNTALAKVGDIITLAFTASESIQTPTVTIADGSATVTGGPAVWSATRTVSGSTPEGVAAFSVTFKDLAGNNGFTTSTTTNASAVTIDTTPPSLPVISTPGGKKIPRPLPLSLPARLAPRLSVL